MASLVNHYSGSHLTFSSFILPLILAFNRLLGGWNSDVITVNHHNFFKVISLQCGTVLMFQHRATAVQPSNRRFQPSVSSLVATKQHPSPFEHCNVVTTTNEDDEYDDDSSQRGER